jgi:hypothetical protein
MRAFLALALLLGQAPRLQQLDDEWKRLAEDFKALEAKDAKGTPTPSKGAEQTPVATEGPATTETTAAPDGTLPLAAGGAAAIAAGLAAAYLRRKKPEEPQVKQHIHNATGKPFKTGARPTSRAALCAAEPFRPRAAALPPYFFIFPKTMSMWGNGPDSNWPDPNGDGDCVSAEEAFNKACSGVFIQDATLYAWCVANGTLNGADLQPVIQQMQASGFSQDSNVYGDGAAQSVNYADQPTLNAAIYQAGTASPAGCVKFGLASEQLPNTAGNNNGWTLAADQQDSNEDHCMGACGFGTIGQFITAINAAFGTSLPVPTSDGNGAPIDPTAVGVAVYTWSTIGWCTFQAFVNMTGEAWIRNPNSTKSGTGTPTPDSVYVTGAPTPPVPPVPPTPPTPPAPGTFVPPFYTFEGQTEEGGPFADVPTATTAAQIQANADQVPVDIRDSKGTLAATVQPNVTPPPPPPSGVQLVVQQAGTYELISSTSAAILAKRGLTVDQYIAAVEALQTALGGSRPRPFH